MIPRQFAYRSGSRRFFPRYIVHALLLGTLGACGGGGGGGGGSSLQTYSLIDGVSVDGGASPASSGQLQNLPAERSSYQGLLNVQQIPSNANRMVGANVAHSRGFKGRRSDNGAPVRVAVLDGEFDTSHPDLVDQFLTENGTVAGQNLREGHQDVRPILRRLRDRSTSNPETDLRQWVEGNAENRKYYEYDWHISHGTHVAGIIAAKDNNFGTKGVAPESKIIPIVIFRDHYKAQKLKSFSNPDPTHRTYKDDNNQLAGDTGLPFVLSKGAFVINNSWGYRARPKIVQTSDGKFFLRPNDIATPANVFQANAKQAWANALNGPNGGAVSVFSAGNNGWNSETGRIRLFNRKYDDINDFLRNYYNKDVFKWTRVVDPRIAGKMKALSKSLNQPSMLSAHFLGHSAVKGKWLAVVAVGGDRKIAPFSNGCGIAKEYCLAAPGVDVRSTFTKEDLADGKSRNSDDKIHDGYHRYSGTSMAAPMVSGALAVLKGRDPQLTAKQAVRIILDTATDLGAPGVDDVYGHGLLNLAKALEPVGAAHAAGRDARALSGFDPRQNAMAFSTAFGNGGARQALTSGVFDKYNRSYQMKTPLQAPIRKAPSLDSLIQFHHGKISAASRTVALDGDGSLFYSMSDDRYGQRGKGVSFDMFGDVQGTHYRTHLAFAKVKIADAMMPSSTHKSLWSGLGSHSRDHMQGRFDTALHENLWLGVYTGRGQLGGTGTTTRTDRADDHGTYRFDDVGMALTHQDRTTRISLSAGRFFEHGRFLASRSEGAFQLDKATRSDYLHLGAATSLSPHIHLSADYMKVKTKVDFRHNAYVDDMTLDADSADARLTVTDVIADNDHFAIGYRLPLAVRHGAMAQHSVKGYDAAGHYHVAVDRIDFAVPKRHRIAHVTYVRQLKARSRGDAAFRWFVEGAAHHNWGNMAGQKNRQINTGLIASF